MLYFGAAVALLYLVSLTYAVHHELLLELLERSAESLSTSNDERHQFGDYDPGDVVSANTFWSSERAHPKNGLASPLAAVSSYPSSSSTKTSTSASTSLSHPLHGPADTREQYTSSLLSKLWSNYHIQTASATTVVQATPVSSAQLIRPNAMPVFNRTERLPADFMWGVASSALQVEGAVAADGRGPSIFDTLTHEFGLFDASLDIAANHYYLYQEDAMRLATMGVRYYSMSISWPRIFPFGNGDVNKKGLQHYIDEIDFLLSQGMIPVVTLFHWDLPTALQEKYNGWLGEEFISDFVNYADTVFKALGDRVKFWVTFNEPQVMCGIYNFLPDAVGDLLPPLQLTPLQKTYTCSRNVLLAHAKVVRLWRDKYADRPAAKVYANGIDESKSINFSQASLMRERLPPLQSLRGGPKLNQNQKLKQNYLPRKGSRIGLKNAFVYMEPLTASAEDATAQYRYLQFTAGWFLNPIFGKGGYPSIINATVPYIPLLTKDEIDLIEGTSDYLAWDGYNGAYVHAPDDGIERCLNNMSHPLYPVCANITYYDENGWLAGAYSDREGSQSTPELFKQGIRWLAQEYNPNEIIISEFGFPVHGESDLPIRSALYDSDRVNYYTDYLNGILDLVALEKINITGALAWAATDNWEWGNYSTRFGLQYVDYETQKRYFKKSMFAFVDFFESYVAKPSLD